MAAAVEMSITRLQRCLSDALVDWKSFAVEENTLDVARVKQELINNPKHVTISPLVKTLVIAKTFVQDHMWNPSGVPIDSTQYSQNS